MWPWAKKNGQKNKEETLPQKRDELAQKHYGRPYDELCSARKRIIDNQIKIEKQQKSA